MTVSRAVVDAKGAGFAKCPICNNYSFDKEKRYCYNNCKFGRGLMIEKCPTPDVSKLECYKKKYIDNLYDVGIFGKKHGNGVYFCIVGKKINWYKLVMED